MEETQRNSVGAYVSQRKALGCRKLFNYIVKSSVLRLLIEGACMWLFQNVRKQQFWTGSPTYEMLLQ